MTSVGEEELKGFNVGKKGRGVQRGSEGKADAHTEQQSRERKGYSLSACSPTMTQSFTFKVSIDCDACRKRVKKALNGIQGVETIDVDMKNEKVTVVGSVDPKVLVKCLQKIGKKVDLQGGKGHYIPDSDHLDDLSSFNSNFNFGKVGNKSKNGPKGKLLSSDADGDEATEVNSHIFSDENANSCRVM
ncbi:hypothetical protein GOP47_0003064 [Adiantum capillus-veneris]|uniref:HMA domain-containing protein n=1 Tax=Adiantum capillus-veneris TaxID=13818 RepID=A0A9D4ZRH5_ADICA|nr:hypothetical protein GOP47_0003064 [Adiantum capillus-veneris]